MKWIGQHIYDSAATFRQDVTIEGNLTVAGTSTTFGDDDKIILGDGGDGEIFVSSDDLYIRNVTVDKDVIFQSDDSSGGEETYFFLDGSSSGAGSPKTVWPDGSAITLGTGNDHISFHNGTDTVHLIMTGGVQWQNFDEGEDYIFKMLADGGATMDTMLTISNSGVTMAGDLIATSRKFTKTGTTDGTYDGDVVYFGGTTSMTTGAIYHYKSDGTWELADADAVANCDGMLAVALGAASDTNGMLIKGMVTLDHDPGAVGDVLFLSTTAGDATATAPSGNNDVIRVLGYCLDASNGQIFFDPDKTYVEVSA